ncbi:hydroxymethylpyrimidine/phosphomethylpyrimidine kinase [Flavobacterium glycines]|uniref:hydroxymethylpyrimidine kinase n=1 Tax=Flavobacterium glycines TaxID=551990 RepID=A0A1B9DS37_9FLAO|nr:hydroxymethylpyrimidine/phosphomethylpyrimidine kinase [Flavobacterium glycines]OCB72503.1 hydroxymethylpyrimidine/phosphomethylpyrimidine kinase [Flavobacterium glycines]GEL09996.1 hydroxymethylpyrimidine/phosphomethylpyrimidine kinase [Flavobacterium glycines]SDI85608.1 hydroxymethylpyrimidine/phosphomethylpyrimidine kinase [Flavobacterium glycines]
MSTNRPFVLSIAGFDPSAGAGVLADIKTFEQLRVQGFAINTGNTIQTESNFFEMQWTTVDFVLRSIEILFQKYTIKAVKIGIVPSLDYLKEIVFTIKKLSPTTKIVWDTVLKSTTDFSFLNIKNQSVLIEILEQIDLITPNYNEILQLNPNESEAGFIAEKLAEHTAVFLKGGHRLEAIGTDYLYTKNEILKFFPKETQLSEKHGSGCVLSSAITANLALEQDLKTACSNAKNYIENYLKSNPTLIGYHYV